MGGFCRDSRMRRRSDSRPARSPPCLRLAGVRRILRVREFLLEFAAERRRELKAETHGPGSTQAMAPACPSDTAGLPLGGEDRLVLGSTRLCFRSPAPGSARTWRWRRWPAPIRPLSITIEAVARYHRGRAESSGFTIADRAVDGDLGGALELARWGRSTGLAPVLVTSALASTLREMAMVASAGRQPAHQLAGQLGMPPWKVEKTQRQARGWRPEGLSCALMAVAAADADVKGGAADQAYAVERVLLAVVQARSAGR